MINAYNIILVAAGGMVGSVLRFLISIWLAKPNTSFYWPTFWVNVLGSLLFGAVIAWHQKNIPASDTIRLLILTGFCGGFTTFSTLSYEAFSLFKIHAYQQLFMYYFATVIAGFLAMAAGFFLIQKL